MGNNYTIIEADGTSKEVVCLAKKLELTKEQQQLVDEYKYLMEKMDNANLVLISDYDCGYTYFVNRENIEKFDWFDECDESVDITDVVAKTNSRQIVHNVNDYGIYAIIKD